MMKRALSGLGFSDLQSDKPFFICKLARPTVVPRLPSFHFGTPIALEENADARQSDGGSAFVQFSPRSRARSPGDPLIGLLAFFLLAATTRY